MNMNWKKIGGGLGLLQDTIQAFISIDWGKPWKLQCPDWNLNRVLRECLLDILPVLLPSREIICHARFLRVNAFFRKVLQTFVKYKRKSYSYVPSWSWCIDFGKILTLCDLLRKPPTVTSTSNVGEIIFAFMYTLFHSKYLGVKHVQCKDLARMVWRSRYYWRNYLSNRQDINIKILMK
jgi:hypothetical protein